ncbi:glycosyltransferase family 1 protein [candidate division KSB1 bacterium]|nr:glycosyltransferase family 4 protein [Candidatus Aminicenantes bacterium]RQW03593.1 MAG: glycosyltransferase family 1 protein [candidate division KSB1 bacterium]
MKKHSRIIVIHLITKLELGGAQLNTIYTAEHLDPLRFDVYLLCGPGGPLSTRLVGSGQRVIVPSLVRRIRLLGDWLTLFSLVHHFRKIKPHIVHTHSSKAGILGRLAAFAVRVPIVIHSVHGFSFSPRQSLLKRNIYLFFEKICRPLTSHFIFVAKSDIESARAHKLLAKNYSLIRSGFPLLKFRRHAANVPALKEKYRLPADSFVCGVIAPFKPQKGLFHLLNIAARVIAENPAVIFFIAGDGEQRPELEAELRRRGITPNFRLPGFIDDIENVMDCFDIGVSTALWEGLPQSLVQLRLKKKAVVASDIPGNREVIRDGLNGYIVALADPEGFASAILKLAADPLLRKRLGGYEQEDFSEWDAAVMVQRQEALYQRLLERSGFHF